MQNEVYVITDVCAKQGTYYESCTESHLYYNLYSPRE